MKLPSMKPVTERLTSPAIVVTRAARVGAKRRKEPVAQLVALEQQQQHQDEHDEQGEADGERAPVPIFRAGFDRFLA